jgi:uncharacterized protein
MSTIRSGRETGYEGARSGNGHVEQVWEGIPARIFLQPVAAPSVLGLFAFAGSTFMVAAVLAGWYGNAATTPLFLFPFAFAFGGIAQFAAALWSYRARDVVATAMHGTWGSFWIAYGIFWLLTANGTLTPPSGSTFVALGYWFIALAAVTFSGTLAALVARNGALFAVLGTLTAGSILLAISYLIGSSTLLTWGGWVLLASALLAWYTATAMMLEAVAGRSLLPLFQFAPAAHEPHPIPVQFASGEPGVKMGQ